jgi:hypothetical protein
MPGRPRTDSPRRSPPVSTALRSLLVATLVAAALFAALARPAAAATPCWKKLLTDWYDGRIDQTYQIHCYTDALKHLPADVQTYSSAHDDILRALQSAKEKLQKGGHTATPTTPVPGGSGGSGGSTTTATTTTTAAPPTGSGSGGTGGGTTTPRPPTGGGSSSGHKPGKGLQGVADRLNPSSPSSLPVPLLVLGGLALLLVAAGAAGLVAKRLQARRPRS